MVLDKNILSFRYSRRDIVIALSFALLVLILSLLSLYPSCNWGDDFAAYINEAIAIANGTFEQQAALNYYMHPSVMPEGTDGTLVYVWGYPLLLSAVYAIFGYDTVNYSSIIYYKLPSVICFAAFSALLFLFMRRRFSVRGSVIITSAFCGLPVFYELINSVYSDVVYMFFCMLSLLLIELYFSQPCVRKRLISGIILGAVLWYSYEVRLNGLTLLVVFMICHVAALIREKSFKISELHVQLAPYITYVLLLLLFERLILLPPTLNSGDVVGMKFSTFVSNALYYIILLVDTIRASINTALVFFIPNTLLSKLPQHTFDFLFNISNILSWCVLLLTAIGVFTRGLKQNLQLTIYAVGSAVGTCALPYTQGLRYLFGVLPVFALFTAYGSGFVVSSIKTHIKPPAKQPSAGLSFTLSLLTILLSISLFAQIFNMDIDNIRSITAEKDSIHSGMDGAYSEDAINVYNFICTNTATDDIITFHKPRALFLNTGRLSFSYLYNNRSPLEADWCILTDFFVDYYTNTETPEWFNEFEPVMTSGEFTVFRNTLK